MAIEPYDGTATATAINGTLLAQTPLSNKPLVHLALFPASLAYTVRPAHST